MALSFQKQFGENVKKFRNIKEITQLELGDLCDIEFQNISRIESGKTNPTLQTILLLAKALGTNPCALLNGVELD